MSDIANDTLSVARPAPEPYNFSRPLYEATREKKLKIQFCRKTGKFQFFPRPVSIFTGRASDLEWREVSGNGTLFAYTIGRRATPLFRGHEPYLVVTVTLDEGVNVIADLIHVTLDEIRIGMRVRPFWAPLPNGTNLLLFEPDR